MCACVWGWEQFAEVGLFYCDSRDWTRVIRLEDKHRYQLSSFTSPLLPFSYFPYRLQASVPLSITHRLYIGLILVSECKLQKVMWSSHQKLKISLSFFLFHIILEFWAFAMMIYIRGAILDVANISNHLLLSEMIFPYAIILQLTLLVHER